MIGKELDVLGWDVRTTRLMRFRASCGELAGIVDEQEPGKETQC
jgi:hypothetical protein